MTDGRSTKRRLVDALPRLPLGEHRRDLAPGRQDCVGGLESCAHLCTEEGDKRLDVVFGEARRSCWDASKEGGVAICGLGDFKLVKEVGVDDEGGRVPWNDAVKEFMAEVVEAV